MERWGDAFGLADDPFGPAAMDLDRDDAALGFWSDALPAGDELGAVGGFWDDDPLGGSLWGADELLLEEGAFSQQSPPPSAPVAAVMAAAEAPQHEGAVSVAMADPQPMPKRAAGGEDSATKTVSGCCLLLQCRGARAQPRVSFSLGEDASFTWSCQGASGGDGDWWLLVRLERRERGVKMRVVSQLCVGDQK